MSETIYTAGSELRRPRRFAADAIRDLRHAPAVAWRLFRSNLAARYRRSWLGYLWLVLPMIGTTLVWMYVQSRQLIATAPAELPYAVHVLAGMLLWQTFLDALNAPLQQLTTGKQMITRSRVPLEALLLSGAYETLFNCAIRMAVLVPVVIAYDVPLRATALLIPIGIIALLIFGLMLGIAATPAGLLYDDVGRAITLIASLWFFVTPVLYPARGAMRWNPLTPLVETSRGWLTGGSSDPGFAIVFALTVPLLVAAWLFLRLARPHVIARLG